MRTIVIIVAAALVAAGLGGCAEEPQRLVSADEAGYSTDGWSQHTIALVFAVRYTASLTELRVGEQRERAGAQPRRGCAASTPPRIAAPALRNI